MARPSKLALHLLVILMVRKSELIEAEWAEFDFDASIWRIPAERMKKDRSTTQRCGITANLCISFRLAISTDVEKPPLKMSKIFTTLMRMKKQNNKPRNGS